MTVQVELTKLEKEFLIAMLQHQERFYASMPRAKYEECKVNHRLANELLYKLDGDS
jgi:hypothetical protein